MEIGKCAPQDLDENGGQRLRIYKCGGRPHEEQHTPQINHGSVGEEACGTGVPGCQCEVSPASWQSRSWVCSGPPDAVHLPEAGATSLLPSPPPELVITVHSAPVPQCPSAPARYGFWTASAVIKIGPHKPTPALPISGLRTPLLSWHLVHVLANAKSNLQC